MVYEAWDIPEYWSAQRFASRAVIERSIEYRDKVQLRELFDRQGLTQVQGTQLYMQDLEWNEIGEVQYWSCTCPQGKSGAFCKHLVAALWFLSGEAAKSEEKSRFVEDQAKLVDEYLDTLHTRDDVLDLLREVMNESVEAHTIVLRQATAAVAAPEELRAQLDEEYRLAFPDWSPSYDYFDDDYLDDGFEFDAEDRISEFLDTLEKYAASGRAKIVEPFVKRAIQRMMRMTEDYDGYFSPFMDQYQRAADMYGEVTALAKPDPEELAGWLLYMRSEAPNPPILSLAPFIPALGDAGLREYRKGVNRLGAEVRNYPDDLTTSQYLIMRLELADLDQDHDAAIRILSQDPMGAAYTVIVNRLISLNRNDEAVKWIRQAIDDERIHFQSDMDNPFLINANFMAAFFAEQGLEKEAEEVFWRYFRDVQAFEVAQSMHRFLKKRGRWETEQNKYWTILETTDWQDSDYPTLVALLIEEPEQAWAYADKYGVDNVWYELVQVAPEVRPATTFDLYMRALDEDLIPTGREAAQTVAGRLLEIEDFIRRFPSPRRDDMMHKLTTRIQQIRAEYRRRPALLEELKKAGF